MSFDALLDELAERVANRVLAKLQAPASHYSAKNPPPGKTRAWALRNLRLIPGAKKVGRDWTVSVADFNAWLSERDTSRVRKSHGDPRQTMTQDVDALAERSLSESGFRRVR